MVQPNNKIKPKEVLRFLVGGGSAVITDYILYRILLKAGMYVSGAKGISYVCGAAVGFVINKVWTFESKGFLKSEIIKYVCLYTVSAIANAAVNKAVIQISNIQLLAFLCATGVSTAMNFVGQKFFVFAKKEIQ